MFAWGLEVDMLPATPVVGVKAPAPARPRERVFTEAEVVALWQAWEAVGWPFGPLFKLLLLTGQRRGAVAEIRLADIGLADQTWTLPPGTAGNARPHDVPLSAFAVEILTSQPRLKSAYVFPARGHPGRPLSGFSKASKRVADLSGVADFRIQDLRRTAAVGMARLGVSPDLIGRILNPASEAAAPGGYAQAQGLLEQKRAALEAWARHLQEVLESGGGLLTRARR